jgi:hypothetical protein
MSATTPTAAEMERLRLRREEDQKLQAEKRDEADQRLRAQQQVVVAPDGSVVALRTPAEEAEFKHQQEERRRAKQVEYDPRIHGAGTVTPVEPQSVRDMFQYYLALEARVKELEVGAEEAAKSRQAAPAGMGQQQQAKVRQPLYSHAPVGEVEESGGTQTEQAKPSPFSPHK